MSLFSEQKGYSYEKKDTEPVVVIDKEEKKALKTGYITLYTKLFMDKESTHQKWSKKNRKTYILENSLNS